MMIYVVVLETTKMTSTQPNPIIIYYFLTYTDGQDDNFIQDLCGAGVFSKYLCSIKLQIRIKTTTNSVSLSANLDQLRCGSGIFMFIYLHMWWHMELIHIGNGM